MYNENTFKIGFLRRELPRPGASATTVPERWSGDWNDCLRLAKMMDDGGIDFMLPIGRWKGYGGETDYQGSTYETITWATLAPARNGSRCSAPFTHRLFHPLIAAKQMVTADHVGHGRFGLNVVCGWNEDEFDMFGVDAKDHAGRYRQGQEWLDVMREAWTKDDFDYSREFYKLSGVREKPKPYGGTYLTMNAGSSGEGRAFALRNCDAWFTSVRHDGSQTRGRLETAIPKIQEARAEARMHGREIGVFTVGVVVCRPTRKEADEYHRYVTLEHADWGASITRSNEGSRQAAARRCRTPSPSLREWTRWTAVDRHSRRRGRNFRANEPRWIFRIGLSFVNYADELPYFLTRSSAVWSGWGCASR